MNVRLRESAVTSALVHHSALISPITGERHASFIARRLAIAFIALGTAPVFLAFHGAPSLLETLVFAFSFTPLTAALVVTRTGRLVAAHAIACLGLLGLALNVGVLGGGTGAMIAWMFASLFEAALSGSGRLLKAASMACVGVLASLALASSLHYEAAFAQPVTSAALGCFALAYVVIIAFDANVVSATTATVSEPDDIEMRSAAVRLLDDLVIGFDASGSVTRVCEGGTSWLGVAPMDFMGRGLFEHVHVADRPGFLKLIADAAYDETPATANLRLRRPDDPAGKTASRPSYMWVEMRVASVVTGGRTAQGPAPVVALLRDAEAAHAHDVEVAAVQTTMEDSIRSKDHFLASMSHELRTPLNAIIGFSEMLGSHTLRPIGPEKQLEYARIINQSGLHLLSVVNSILDMSKIRAGSFTIVPEAFDAVPLLDLACDMIALKAEEGSVTLVRDYPESLEEIVGDKRACKQILINLLSNAVKFTAAHGTVTLSARPEGNSLAMTVRDDGIGIGATDLTRLGDPFFQARSSLSRPFEGTGLGLSVVRGLVGLHGGSITIESELGRGTCVRVLLPLDCRAIPGHTHSATIETFPRHPAFEANVSRIDRRIKQSA